MCCLFYIKRWLLGTPFWQINNCFISSLPHCALFFCTWFWTSPKCLASWTEHQEAPTVLVLRTGHGRNACRLQSLLSLIVFMSVEWTFDGVLQCFISIYLSIYLSIYKVHEKRRGLLSFTSVCFYLIMIGNILVELVGRWKKYWNRQIMTKI